MLNVLAWLVGSQWGRIAALVAVASLAIGVVVLRAYSTGKQHERLLEQQRQLEALKNEIKINSEVRNMSRDERRNVVRKWLRPDD